MHRAMFKSTPPIGDPNLINNNSKKEYEDSEYYSVEWNKYYDRSRDIELSSSNTTGTISNNKFRIYETNIEVNDGYLFVFLHGGGYTSLSWSLVSEIMKKSENKNFRILAYDCRGHGQTKTNDDFDLSIETLVNDCSTLVNYYNEDTKQQQQQQQKDNNNEQDKFPFKVILVGHSLGGAVVVKSAKLVQNLMAVVVVDVVEGTAMNALSSMRSIIEKRPRSFKDEKDAIKWSVSSNTIKNLESARVSIPSQIKFNDSDKKYHWITDLGRTELYWKDWFTGLSKEFLTCATLKLLILAGTDRLDRELTIGQMQGKFQLVLLPQCGHVVQEDNPTSTAEALLEFLSRLK